MDTKVLDPPMAAPARGFSIARSFLPFWIALLLGSGVLGWDYHRRNAPLTVLECTFTVDGRPYEGTIQVLVDGKQQGILDPVRIGNRRIQFTAPDTAVREVQQFVWYGPLRLGQIDFQSLRGVLEVKSTPPAEKYELRGAYFRSTNSTGVFLDVPAGEYDLRAWYGEFAEERRGRVTGLRTNETTLLPRIGSLELGSEPAGAEFELTSRLGEITRRGTMPTLIRYLPVGEYRLSTRLNSFERQTNVLIRVGVTNAVRIQFEHARVEIESDPRDADVFWESNPSGRTPYTREGVKPGKYRYEVKKAGFDPFKGEIQVAEGEQAKQVITLVNSQCRIATEEGRNSFDRRDYHAAIRSFETALRIDPNSPVATKLLPQARAALGREEAVAAANKGEFDLAFAALARSKEAVPNDEETSRLLNRVTEIKSESDRRQADVVGRNRENELAARRREAAITFEQSIADEKEPGAFQTVVLRTGKSIPEVREACLKIGKANPGFKAVERPVSDARQLQFKFGGLVPLIGLGNYARLHAMEIGPGETEIRYKMFVFVSGNGGPATSSNPQLEEGFKGALRATLDGDLK